MTVFQVAAQGQLPGTLALWWPFAPVEGIESPWSHVVAHARLGIRQFVAKTAWHTIRQARVGARPDIGEPQGRVGDVPLRARGGISGVGRRHELRRAGATARRRRRVCRVARAAVVGRGWAGPRLRVREAQRGGFGRHLVVLLLGRRALHRRLRRRSIGGHDRRSARHASWLQDTRHGGCALVVGGARGSLLQLDMSGAASRVLSRGHWVMLGHAAGHMQLVELGAVGALPPRCRVLLVLVHRIGVVTRVGAT